VWESGEEWTFHDAALHGSSYYVLPAPLRWLTADIGIHHVHHLASRIPFYRLRDALQAIPGLAEVNRIGIVESFRTVRLVLWDEQQRRLVTFREARC
jgi:omega-6 fatty acid desaturase (delta-12 desaturase)